MRQSRNYGALNETQRQIDEQLNSRPETPEREASRQPRHYGALHETQRQIDDQENSPAAPVERPDRPHVQRSWTHHGGMVPHHRSANIWIRQNYEIRMAESDKPGTGREGEQGAQPSQPNREQNQAELQEARAAVEEARRREAAERARTQERERGGPER